MNPIHFEAFNVAGISIRTTNENNKAAIDIPALWKKFMSGNIAARLSGRIDDAIYCVYTDYEKDHTKPYTVILGCRVEDLNIIGEEFTGKAVAGGKYQKFTAEGDIAGDAVFGEWLKIWSSPIERTFTADFEIYDTRAWQQENAEVDIFIAVK